jgi:hypothetical protein
MDWSFPILFIEKKEKGNNAKKKGKKGKVVPELN